MIWFRKDYQRFSSLHINLASITLPQMIKYLYVAIYSNYTILSSPIFNQKYYNYTMFVKMWKSSMPSHFILLSVIVSPYLRLFFILIGIGAAPRDFQFICKWTSDKHKQKKKCLQFFTSKLWMYLPFHNIGRVAYILFIYYY